MNIKEDNNAHTTHIEMKRGGGNDNFIVVEKCYTNLKKLLLCFHI